jgi:hypothetical protein
MPCRPSGGQNENEGATRRPEVECATVGIYTHFRIATEQSESQRHLVGCVMVWICTVFGFQLNKVSHSVI